MRATVGATGIDLLDERARARISSEPSTSVLGRAADAAAKRERTEDALGVVNQVCATQLGGRASQRDCDVFARAGIEQDLRTRSGKHDRSGTGILRREIDRVIARVIVYRPQSIAPATSPLNGYLPTSPTRWSAARILRRDHANDVDAGVGVVPSASRAAAFALSSLTAGAAERDGQPGETFPTVRPLKLVAPTFNQGTDRSSWMPSA
jgi:hypothetical protein